MNLSSCREIERFVSYPLFIIIDVMDLSHVERAAELAPELLPAAAADRLLATYARAEKLAGYGVAALAARRDDATKLARITGSSIGRAKAVVATGHALPASGNFPRRCSRATSRSIKPVRSRPRNDPRRGPQQSF
jgi:hypothetical protein